VAVIDGEDGVVEEVGAVPELGGGEDRGHKKQLLQAIAWSSRSLFARTELFSGSVRRRVSKTASQGVGKSTRLRVGKAASRRR
jgi:hypothetical protein